MNILISSDHAGFKLKSFLINNLKKDYKIKDLGCFSEDSIDYPDIASNLCQKLLDNSNQQYNFGILICGTGIGVSIAANKFKNIRAALCTNPEIARLSRNHNDANILCLGSRMVDQETAINCCREFFQAEFEFGRHLLRINKIKND